MNDTYITPMAILPLFFLIFLIVRLLTIFIHELGHAIPARVFTKGKVIIYLGSYGNREKSKRINLSKRLQLYFRMNPFKWRGGMVKHDLAGPSSYKQLAILVFGPLSSLLLSSLTIYLVYAFDLNGFIKLFTLFFFISALIDLRNIYPKETKIILFDGSITYNDGYQIVQLFKHWKEHKILFAAYDFYNKGDYSNVVSLFERLDQSFINKSSLTLAINSFIQIKDFNGAKTFYNRFINLPVFHTLDSEGLFCVGLVESRLDEHTVAIEYYNMSIELNGNSVNSFCNRGYTYNLFERYAEAINDFNQAINIDPGCSYAYSNRAFSKIKLKLFNDALEDIDKALAINPNDSYSFRNLGVYYLEIGNYTKAMEQFSISYNLDPDTHLITEYMAT